MKKNKLKSKKEVRMLKLIKCNGKTKEDNSQRPVEIILTNEESWFTKALERLDKKEEELDALE